ncbi:hypothetical protein [Metaclostridioides mangenotii]|nr:hypothetical protein [Clostridioides mangenotii]
MSKESENLTPYVNGMFSSVKKMKKSNKDHSDLQGNLHVEFNLKALSNG